MFAAVALVLLAGCGKQVTLRVSTYPTATPSPTPSTNDQAACTMLTEGEVGNYGASYRYADIAKAVNDASTALTVWRMDKGTAMAHLAKRNLLDKSLALNNACRAHGLLPPGF
jgi:hypothetical protein